MERAMICLFYFIEQALRQGGKFLLSFRTVNRRADAEIPAEHTIHITIDYGSRNIKGNGSYGSSSIVTHSLQGTNTFKRSGKATTCNYLTGSGMEVTGTAVIA
jgi:hypothetical protein